jgi:hypothetical protein
MTFDRLLSISRITLAACSLFLAAICLPVPASAIVVAGDALADNTMLICTSATETAGMVVNDTGNYKCYSATPLVVNFSTADRYLWIACFSDHLVGQGLLHDLTIDGNPVYSGNTFWTVAAGDTAVTSCPGNGPATNATIRGAMASRIPTATFVPTTNGCINSLSGCYSIWGQFAQINSSSRWTWFNSGSQVSTNAPFQPGFNHRELLIFRLDMFEFLSTPGLPTSWGAVKNTYR